MMHGSSALALLLVVSRAELEVDSPAHSWEIVGNDVSDLLELNPVVSVSGDVAEATHLIPLDIRMALLELIREPTS